MPSSPTILIGSGLCGCGCGRTTSVLDRDYPSLGFRRGQHRRFLKGHSRRLSGVDYLEEDRGYKTPCWVWQLGKFASGYAQTGRGRRAHVVYWEQKFGPVPEGLQLDHLCRVIDCVNPDHLEAVTAASNVRRSSATKLTQEQVDIIRSAVSSGVLQVDLALEYGVHPSQISRIVNYRRWFLSPAV